MSQGCESLRCCRPANYTEISEISCLRLHELQLQRVDVPEGQATGQQFHVDVGQNGRPRGPQMLV